MSTPDFLGISAELRNIIYRMVLVDDEAVEVGFGFEEPALLHVSRGIRDETKSIYYRENQFVLEIASFDPTLPLRWTHKMNVLEAFGDTNLLLDLDMDAHWPNLMIWLQHLHAGAIATGLNNIVDDGDVETCKDLVDIMFRQVEDLRVTPWVHVEKAMRHFRGLMSAFDGGWHDVQMTDDPSEGSEDAMDDS